MVQHFEKQIEILFLIENLLLMKNYSCIKTSDLESLTSKKLYIHINCILIQFILT